MQESTVFSQIAGQPQPAARSLLELVVPPDEVVTYDDLYARDRAFKALVEGLSCPDGNPKKIAKKTAIYIRQLQGKITSTSVRASRRTGQTIFKIGRLLILARGRFANPEQDRRNRQDFVRWRRGIFYGKYGDRMLQQAISIAEMGPLILKFADGGKDRMLEIRWIVQDLPEFRDRTGSVTQEELSRALAEIILRFPFPTIEEVGIENFIKATRHHCDSIATFFRLRNAGVPPDAFTFDDAKSIAIQLRKTIERQEADHLAKWINDPEVTGSPGDKFKRWMLDGMAFGGEPLGVNPMRIVDSLAKIAGWADDGFVGNSEIAKDIAHLLVGVDALNAAVTVVNRLQQDVHSMCRQDGLPTEVILPTNTQEQGVQP